MKAQGVCSPRHGHDSRDALGLGKCEHPFRISKPSLENGEQEMQACFSKLKELVPTVPHDKKLSKVQLLQHVIDYILDLELTLDTHPTMRTTPSILQALTDNRKPLTESLHLNTLQIDNTDDVPSLCQSTVSC